MFVERIFERLTRFSYEKCALVTMLSFLIPGMLLRFTTAPKGGTAILLLDLAVFLGVGIWLARQIFLRKAISTHRLVVLLGTLCVTLLLSYIQGFLVAWSSGPLTLKDTIVAFLYVFRFSIYTGIVIMTVQSIRKEADIRWWIAILVWIFFFMILGGYFQRIFFPDFFEFFVKYGWDPHQNRLLGSFFDPNFMGAYLVTNILLLISIVLHDPRSRPWFSFVLFLGIIALGLTLSRSAFLAFVIGFVIITLVRARWLLVSGLIGMILVVMMIPALSDRISQGVALDDSSQKHVESWVTALHLFQVYPVMGVGYNFLPVIQENLALADEWDVNNRGGFENSFLSVLVYSGLVGFIAFCLFWGATIWYGFANVFKRTNTRYLQGVSLGITAAIISCIVSSMLINTLFFSFILVQLWILVGMLVWIDSQSH